MNPDRLTERGVKFDSFELGQLSHYRLRNNKMSKSFPSEAFTNIEPCFEECVFGVLYTLPADADLSMLDRKEGYPTHYEKTFVPIQTFDGIKPNKGIVVALTYIATRAWSTDKDQSMPDKYASLINDGLDVCKGLTDPHHTITESFLHYRDRAWEMTNNK